MKFPPAQIKHRDRRGRNDGRVVDEDDDRPRFDFSYSGIKTAILRYVEAHDMRAAVEARRQALLKIAKPKLEDYLANCDKLTLDLVASFQRAIVEDLVGKTLDSGPRLRCRHTLRHRRSCRQPGTATDVRA